MGGNRSKHELIISSLNFSGVQESPYEFYENQDEKQIKINELFVEVCTKYVKGFQNQKFKWKMAKMDKQWHTRFSPIYKPLCGLIINKKTNEKTLITDIEEFRKEWENNFKDKFNSALRNKIYGQISEEQLQKKLQEQKPVCLQFDYCIYETILRYVYDIKKEQQIKDKNLDAKKYIDFQKRTFNKAFLDQELKLAKTISSIKANKNDILFIQQGSQNLSYAMKILKQQFKVIQNFENHMTSMIFIRLDKFPEMKEYENSFKDQNQRFRRQYESVCHKDIRQQLNWNKDTVFQVINNKILISTHLTSKKQSNPEQIKQMKASIAQIKQRLPHYELIIGGDLNGPLQHGFQIQTSKGPINMHVYPEHGKDSTVYKKRTFIQAQKNKANTLSNEVKDYLISSYRFISSSITTINDIKVDNSVNPTLLPNAEHPYDHYLVVGKIKTL